jgi:alkylhydroperoxidase/carboxymuconolactone decarboxylase family protein YurZ
MTHWKQLYLSAILGTDEQTNVLIDAAVHAIDVRLDELNELNEMAGHDVERKEIADATTALLAIKAERGSWGKGHPS